MTPAEFVMQIEAYYGRYPTAVVREAVRDYLGHLDVRLAALFRVLIEAVSNKYGKVPDVAAIAEVLREHRKSIERLSGDFTDEAGQVWSRGRLIGHYDGSVFIPDLRGLPRSLQAEYAVHFDVLGSQAAFIAWIGERALEKQLLPESKQKQLSAPAPREQASVSHEDAMQLAEKLRAKLTRTPGS